MHEDLDQQIIDTFFPKIKSRLVKRQYDLVPYNPALTPDRTVNWFYPSDEVPFYGIVLEKLAELEDEEKKKKKNKTRVSVGYYGPRGEKLFTEHIVATLSDRLRDRAAGDRLMAAQGTAGGVSGFVQAVLVPELAVALVQHDIGCGAERAREILEESTELGELMNEEQHERVDDEDEEEV